MKAERGGIIGYPYVASDDGKLALVEFVARDRQAEVKLFDKATAKASDAAREFRQFKPPG